MVGSLTEGWVVFKKTETKTDKTISKEVLSSIKWDNACIIIQIWYYIYLPNKDDRNEQFKTEVKASTYRT